MARGNPAHIVRAPGRIVVNPTDLSQPYPFGGVEVGLTMGVRLQPLGSSFRVLSEGLGEATDQLEGNIRWVFAFVVRNWDDDAVRLFYSGGYSEGPVTRHALLSEPGFTTPGASALPRALTVLYVPDDRVNVNAALIYRGVPEWPEGADIAFERGVDQMLPVALECFRDSNNRIHRVGRLADFSLT